MTRSSRDREQMRHAFETWLAARLPAGAAPSVSEWEGTAATGMSSDTVLLRAAWTEGGARHDERLVARFAPDEHDVPVFPEYDLGRQFEVIRRVGERTNVPVPGVRWLEPGRGAVGAPFFVMDRIDGEVPPDVMPYTFGDNWLFDAAPEDQRRLQDATVATIADLHAIERPTEDFAFLEFASGGDTHLRRHVMHTRDWYEFVAAGGGRSPLVERAFAWLDEHWPPEEGDPVVSWGDSRIGNVMYRDFTPVGVFDWEMAGLGPRELDVAWLLYAQCVFQDIAGSMGLPGMPGFLRRDDVAATYEKLTGHACRALDFFTAYCAVQWAIVGLRTGARAIHFGDRDRPDDIDDLVLNRSGLERMLSGDYWK
jgi:aminoglycoside phosphotransferase (APT) family kinase protein